MNISSWKLFYKIHETENRPSTTQMCYEPRINPEGNILCMNFCFPSDYQINQPRLSYTEELVDFGFQREIYYLQIFKDMPWAPEIIDIEDKKIFIKWYNKTCNQSIYRDNDLNLNWYTDLKKIILDQVKLGFLKATIYPHSHYYDNQGNMRTIDFYATVEKKNTLIPVNQIIGLIGFDTDRFIQAQEGQMINIETIFKSGLLKYSKWPDDLFDIYKQIYNE